MPLTIIIMNRLKELEISAKLVFTYHILLDTQRMSLILVKLLAIEIIYNDVFNSVSLEWHYSALMGSMRSTVLVYVCTHNAHFFLSVLQADLSNILFSSFLWCVTFPFLCSPIFSSLSFIHPANNLVCHTLLLLAGNLRLQQIVNPVDPLEILADVHWTHIREKEEEEKMIPTSKSSTSRGNFASRGNLPSPALSVPGSWLQLFNSVASVPFKSSVLQQGHQWLKGTNFKLHWNYPWLNIMLFRSLST